MENIIEYIKNNKVNIKYINDEEIIISQTNPGEKWYFDFDKDRNLVQTNTSLVANSLPDLIRILNFPKKLTLFGTEINIKNVRKESIDDRLIDLISSNKSDIFNAYSLTYDDQNEKRELYTIRLNNTTLDKFNFMHTIISTYSRITESTINNCTFRDIRSTKFTKCIFNDCDFSWLSSKNLVFENCAFRNCKFDHSRNNKITLISNTFNKCNFINSSFDVNSLIHNNTFKDCSFQEYFIINNYKENHFKDNSLFKKFIESNINLISIKFMIKKLFRIK